MIQIIGSYISPYVRKVLVMLELKGLAYRIDPIVAFMADDEFSRLSPLRRIPVLIDGPLTLCDSSVICQYLEERYPEPPLYPADVALRARARWLEEYADTRLGDVLIWKVFNQAVINPHIWGKPTDEAILKEALEVDVPQVFDYLESQLPGQGFACGAFSIADIALAAFFRNASYAKLRPDPARWPRLAAYVERALAHPGFEKLKPWEDKMRRTPVAQHREALAQMGAPLTERTYGTATARRGIMRT